MASVRPWSVRAEGEVVRFPRERVEGWARFDTFFQEEHERLFKALYFVTGNRHDAEELMQEAFLRLWERWHEIERIDDPTAYLFRVSLNAFRSRRRRAATALRRVSPMVEVRDEFTDAEMRADVRRLLLGCTPRQRAALVLVDLLGYPSEQAARILGVRPSTVRALATQGRQSIRGTEGARMPEMQEVFRLATNKVKPDPNALERQQRRQRSNARQSRRRAYIAVAAVIAVVAVGAFTIIGVGNGNDETAGNTGSQPDGPHVRHGASPGANAQTPAIVDLRGRQTGQVAGLPVDAFAPSVSADGSTIAFVAAPERAGLQPDRRCGRRRERPHFVSTPLLVVGATVAISPDASKVAFEGLTTGNVDIYVVGVDGTGLRQLTTDPATDQYPQWSPDGKTIVYDNAGARENSEDPQFSKTAEIFTVPANGGAPTQVTHNSWPDAAPSYSPTGKTIVDQSAQDFSMMAPDGSNERRFPVGMGGFTPRWSPDGKTIAFSYYKDVSNRPTVQLGDQYGVRPLVIVALVNVASGKVTRLTNVGMATDLNTPQWLDNGHLLVMRVPAKG
jgi:RNA polymerase sigma factor (sigma-70 family)